VGGIGAPGVGAVGNGLGGPVVTGANQQLGAAQSPNCIPASGSPATMPTTPTPTPTPGPANP
jgi:hypothetical protein